jgi:hypothetical protein
MRLCMHVRWDCGRRCLLRHRLPRWHASWRWWTAPTASGRPATNSTSSCGGRQPSRLCPTAEVCSLCECAPMSCCHLLCTHHPTAPRCLETAGVGLIGCIRCIRHRRLVSGVGVNRCSWCVMIRCCSRRRGAGAGRSRSRQQRSRQARARDRQGGRYDAPWALGNALRVHVARSSSTCRSNS